MLNRFVQNEYPEIKIVRTIEGFNALNFDLSNTCIAVLDFTEISFDYSLLIINSTTFLGCHFKQEDLMKLYEEGAVIFPKTNKLPYNPYRTSLYSVSELNTHYQDSYRDHKIFDHFTFYRYANNIEENLWQRIHDHAVDSSLTAFLKSPNENGSTKKIVGIMGGHGVARDSKTFLKCALLTQKLSKKGYTIATGGGPGIMEAANMGAYFGAYSEKNLLDAIQRISESPNYTDSNFTELALDLIQDFPNGYASLAIPTWFYGHEPSNAFSSHIAKYFSNSIREDTLLAIALHGVIFCPGSAGTVQEIFADAAQNHYATFKYISPMIFYGVDYYTKSLPVKPLIHALSAGKKYSHKIIFHDDQEKIVNFIESNPPSVLPE